MNIFERIWAKHKAKTIRQRTASIYDEFKVIERGGQLWLTHLGVAFMVIDKDLNADGVAKALNQARKTAVLFDYAKPSAENP